MNPRPVAAAVLAGPALAGQVGSTDASTIVYTAAPGEQNNLAVSVSGGNLVILDTGTTAAAAPIAQTLAGGPVACVLATTFNSNDTVKCPAAGLTTLSMDVGDCATNQATIAAGVGAVLTSATLIGGSGADTLTGGSENDTLAGRGGNDVLDGGGGTNTVDYSTAANGATVDLGAGEAADGDGGTDVLVNIQNVIGSPSGDTIAGDSNDNVLSGGGGSDTIAGAGGNDTLSGGTGTDTVTYGPRSSYAGSPNPVTVNLATGTATGDGTDALSSFEIANGSSFDDTLVPASFGSTLQGGPGNDTFVSGPGEDVVDYSGASSPITADLGAGTATGAGFDTFVPNSIEDLIGSPRNDSLRGDANDNVLSGGAGNDTLQGGGGNDTLDGGAGTNTVSYINAAAAVSVNLRTGLAPTDGDGGSDTLVNIQNVTGSSYDDTIEGDSGNNVLDGGGGNDTVSYAGSSGPVIVDLGSGTETGDGSDTLSNFDNVRGSNYADILTGDGNANLLSGGLGDDQLSGAGGDDTLNGEDGNDTLNGGAGNDVLNGGIGNDTLSGGSDGVVGDTIDGGPGTDTIDYSAAPAAVAVDLSISAPQNTGGDGLDTITNVENLTGSAFADLLTGDGNDNVLSGGGGDDTLNGGLGDDTLIGGTGSDTASFAGGPAVDANLTTGQATGAGTDSLSSIENLVGSASNDVLTGNAANNLLNGGLGDDDLNGGGGNDSLVGGGGMDTADYSSAPNGVTVDLGAGTSTGYGNDLLTAIENVTGSAYADSITGDGAANLLVGSGGDDWIDGAGGDDTIDGGLGNDFITGGAGNDMLFGGPGLDSVNGGSGDDMIAIQDGQVDQATCGDGTDSVTADAIDVIAGDCEFLNGHSTDTTPPVLVPTVTGTLGSGGWYTSDVHVTWSVTDPQSSISSSSGCGAASVTSDTSTTGVTLTCSATSGGGTSSQSVTIKRDATRPVLSGIPAGQTLEATGPGGAHASFATPTATDAVDGALPVTCDHASGATYPLGTTHVTCTATDLAGNSATGSVDITVRDTTPPVLGGWRGPTTFPATGLLGAVLTFPGPTAVDTVNGSVPVTCSPASGSFFAVGLTLIFCTASDLSGNTTSATFVVQVVLSASQLLTRLQAEVNAAPSLHGNAGPVKALRNKLLDDLQDAVNKLQNKKPDVHGACSSLATFVTDATNPHNVQPKGPLSAADSAFLASEAAQIRTVLGC